MAGYRIGLGVTGGIAAYKAVEVLRLLQKAGCDGTVAMTRHATEFVQPLTFRALTERHVIVNDYDPKNTDPIAHINFSQNIDLLLIVPATANIIAKFANGIADDFLSSTYLASTAPVMIAPAMNTTMWESAATRRNVEQLRLDGVHFVEPIAGELACRTVGAGKLEDAANIVSQALRLLSESTASAGGGPPAFDDIVIAGGAMPRANAGGSNLVGEHFLITVGGTREAIDPVRFISNHSSGKMGFAMAQAAAARGAEVTVVAGATSVEPPGNALVIRVTTAVEMHAAVIEHLASTTVFIGAAAVADYAPEHRELSKIKKDGSETITLTLKRTPDILAEVSRLRHPGMLVVGFAAETNNVEGYARAKMASKSLDLVVANDITAEGAGFDADTNIATVIACDGRDVDLPLMSKREMADRILDEIIRLRRAETGV